MVFSPILTDKSMTAELSGMLSAEQWIGLKGLIRACVGRLVLRIIDLKPTRLI